MSFIDHKTKTINFKIVYHGAGLAGKTTNIQYIYDTAQPKTKGKLISLATETDRTLFFDFLPYGMPNFRGYAMKFHLYTVPG
jgi:signal recognition particle receptor subunit beta